jgi:hypothetical protein
MLSPASHYKITTCITVLVYKLHIKAQHPGWDTAPTVLFQICTSAKCVMLSVLRDYSRSHSVMQALCVLRSSGHGCVLSQPNFK